MGRSRGGWSESAGVAGSPIFDAGIGCVKSASRMYGSPDVPAYAFASNFRSLIPSRSFHSITEQ